MKKNEIDLFGAQYNYQTYCGISILCNNTLLALNLSVLGDLEAPKENHYLFGPKRPQKSGNP